MHSALRVMFRIMANLRTATSRYLPSLLTTLILKYSSSTDGVKWFTIPARGISAGMEDTTTAPASLCPQALIRTSCVTEVRTDLKKASRKNAVASSSCDNASEEIKVAKKRLFI